MKTSREMADIIRHAKRQGWAVSDTRRHVRFTNPGGQVYVAPRTPSDWRSTRNVMAGLRRLGLRDWRRPHRKKESVV